MSRVDQGYMLAKALCQNERIELVFPKEEVQPARTVIGALNAIDAVLRKPAQSAARGLLLTILGFSLFATELTLKDTVRPTSLVVVVLLIFSPVIIYKLRAREARNRELPKVMKELEDLFHRDPSLIGVLTRIKSLELEPFLLARVAPYIPQLSSKGG